MSAKVVIGNKGKTDFSAGRYREYIINSYIQTEPKNDKEFNTKLAELTDHCLKIMPEEVTTKQIRDITVKALVERISIDEPQWDKLASFVFLEGLYKSFKKQAQKCLLFDEERPLKSRRDFEIYLQLGIDSGRLVPDLAMGYDLDQLIYSIDFKRDNLFNYLGAKTIYDKYLIKNQDNEVIEVPQFMFLAIGMFLAKNEHPKRKTNIAIDFYNVLSQFKVMLSTPILSNARTTRYQLNSCYIGSTDDSIEGIFDAYKDMALISKNGGGIGWDFSGIRSIGSTIDGFKNVGGGLIPFLKIANDVAIAVDQLGTRKGAIAVWCEIWHLEIEDFIELRKNSGDDRRRAHDLFPALWICDLFMERVVKDQEWTLFNPKVVPPLLDSNTVTFNSYYEHYENSRDLLEPANYKVVKARHIWKKILTQLFETGTPFLGFKDTANLANLNDHIGLIRSSNLCTEIFQVTEPSKIGTSIEAKWVPSTRTNSSLTEMRPQNQNITLQYDNDSYIKVASGAIKPPNKLNVTDQVTEGLYNYKVEFTKQSVIEEAKTAVCTLGSINLARVNDYTSIREVTETLVRMLDNSIDLNCYPIKSAYKTHKNSRSIGIGVMGEAEMLASKSIVFGSKEHKYLIDDLYESISFHIINASCWLAQEKGNYPECRNSSWYNGITPVDCQDSNIQIKQVLKDKPENGRDGLVDWKILKKRLQMYGVRNGYLMAIAPTSSISILCGTTQSIEPLYSKLWYEENISGLIPVTAPNYNETTAKYYKTAYEVEPKDLIELAGIRQKWIDQGQSLNIFVKSDIKGKELSDLYIYAWRCGLKSTYYCRTINAEDENNKSCSIGCESCQ